MNDSKWTKKFPDSEGLYLFYGFRYGRISCGNPCKPEWSLVKVMKITNGFMHTADGGFMFESEVEEAWFKKLDENNIPEGFEI